MVSTEQEPEDEGGDIVYLPKNIVQPSSFVGQMNNFGSVDEPEFTYL